ncbi:hypothetical protein F4779DRAFT_620278 [Xylariaceae sp. FL0662B]|nr:hypothetical protein F4779DRAFT_620278 [Xylariaceae sp. FL0662B]
MPEPQAQRKLAGSNVLIIGGSSGIGFAVAKACLGEGAHITLVSSKESRVAFAINRLRAQFQAATQIEGKVCDVGNADTLDRNLEILFASFKEPLDHIVFTAGDAIAMGPVSGFSTAAITQAGVVRFLAPLLLAKYAAQHLRAGHVSSLTLTGVTVAHKPQPGWVIPAAYGAGLEGIVRGLAVDLKPARVNAVVPGAVMTELWDPMPAEVRKQTWEAIARGHTTGHMGDPEDVAEAYIYLMKDRNCSGTLVHSDGGALVM